MVAQPCLTTSLSIVCPCSCKAMRRTSSMGLLAPRPTFVVSPEFFQISNYAVTRRIYYRFSVAFACGTLSSYATAASRTATHANPHQHSRHQMANSPAPLSTAHNIFAPAIPQLKVIKSTRHDGFRSRGQATAAVSLHAYPLNQINKHYKLFKFLLAFSCFHMCRHGTAHAFNHP